MTAPEIFERAVNFANLMRDYGADTKFGQKNLVLPSITVDMKLRAGHYPPESQTSIKTVRKSVLPAFSLTGLIQVSAAEMDRDYLFIVVRGYPEPMVVANHKLTNDAGRSHETLWRAGKDIGFNIELQPSVAAITCFSELEAKIVKDKFELITTLAYSLSSVTTIDTADCILGCLTNSLYQRYGTPRN